MNKTLRRIVTGIAAVMVLGGTLTAQAQAWTWTSMGGTVTVSGKTISLRDSGNDGHFVTTEYRHNGGASTSGLANKLGYGKTTSATMSTNITNAKVCKSGGGVLPVDCGRWYY